MNVEASAKPLSVNVPVSRITDLVLQPLPWIERKNRLDRRRFDAEVMGRDYVISENEYGVWHFNVANNVFVQFETSEEAFAAADKAHKDWLQEFLAATVTNFVVPVEAILPESPTPAMLRALFTLNSGTPRSTAEVTQVYRSVRNLAALDVEEDGGLEED
jgi:hypothetical protein